MTRSSVQSSKYAKKKILVGAGDNGGDGLYAGAELANEGAHVDRKSVV